MAPWILPLIAFAQNKKQEKAAREQNAQQQIHAIRSRLAAQSGSPGFQEQAAGNMYALDKRLEQQSAANNQALIGAWLQSGGDQRSGDFEGFGYRDGEYDPSAASKDTGNFARQLMRQGGYR